MHEGIDNIKKVIKQEDTAMIYRVTKNETKEASILQKKIV